MSDEERPSEAVTPTIALIPGAFTSEGALAGLARRLGEMGYPTVTAPVALDGIAADTAALIALLDRTDGDVVLVAHSYGGMLISNGACAERRVAALVFVAAVAPEDGETMDDLVGAHPDAVPGEATIQGLSGDPSWKRLPSWFVYGDADGVIAPAIHARLAARAGAVASLVVPGAGHDLFAERPDEVLRGIGLAVDATIAQVPNPEAD